MQQRHRIALLRHLVVDGQPILHFVARDDATKIVVQYGSASVRIEGRQLSGSATISHGND